MSVGGRTGMTAVVTAMVFGVSLFFAPTITAIPPQAYGPALMIVGAMMIAPIRKTEFDDYTELIPAFAIISLMSFTYNIGAGITAGFVLYPWFKVAAGRGREIRPGLWVMNILSMLFFVFYPY